MTDRDAERYIVGRNSVIEALSADSQIDKIFLQYGTDDPQIHRIRALADRKKVACSAMDKGKFRALEKSIGIELNGSQGVIALRSLSNATTLEELLSQATPTSILLVLDGITDPHNLGAIARSAEGVGVLGLVLPTQYTAPITSVVVKSSAGAIEHLNIARVTRVSDALKKCKDAGFTIFGAGSPGTIPYTKAKADGPVALVIGDEGEGLHPSVQKLCDEILEIPMHGQVSSLNASVAAGILLFDLVR